MEQIRVRFLLVPALLLAAACQAGSPDADARHEAERERAHTPAHEDQGHAAGEAGAEHESLPLRPIMQKLASDMAAFSYAMWLQDYGVMAEHAASIASHPHISPQEVQRIEAELGPEMHTFEELDEVVHVASERLHEAAEARQLDDVLTRLDEVQRGCVACHTRFRDRLRTDVTRTAGPE